MIRPFGDAKHSAGHVETGSMSIGFKLKGVAAICGADYSSSEGAQKAASAKGPGLRAWARSSEANEGSEGE